MLSSNLQTCRTSLSIRIMQQHQQDAAGVLQHPSDASMASKSLSSRPKSGNGGTPASSAIAAPATADHHQAQKCPRCDSLNTKFCYYNNYSLAQPRHFCKNCRRYWTKGGALRNVPVGGGCRKNKRLKHRDANSLASLAEMRDAPSTSLLSSITGCGGPLQLPPEFGPSTSSLMSELAREGQYGYGYTFSGLHESLRSPSSIPPSTQDFFAGASPDPGMLSTATFNDPSFPALIYPKSDPPPHAMFHHPHDLPPAFFEQQDSGQSLPETSDQLPSSLGLSVRAAPPLPRCTTTRMDCSQPSRMQQMPLMHRMEAHVETGDQLNEDQQGVQEKEKEEMIFLRSKGSASVCWQNMADSGGYHGGFFAPQAGPPNIENSLWNVSWPEMHAALAGTTTSSAAGAMLH